MAFRLLAVLLAAVLPLDSASAAVRAAAGAGRAPVSFSPAAGASFSALSPSMSAAAPALSLSASPSLVLGVNASVFSQTSAVSPIAAAAAPDAAVSARTQSSSALKSAVSAAASVSASAAGTALEPRFSPSFAKGPEIGKSASAVEVKSKAAASAGAASKAQLSAAAARPSWAAAYFDGGSKAQGANAVPGAQSAFRGGFRHSVAAAGEAQPEGKAPVPAPQAPKKNKFKRGYVLGALSAVSLPVLYQAISPITAYHAFAVALLAAALVWAGLGLYRLGRMGVRRALGRPSVASKRRFGRRIGFALGFLMAAGPVLFPGTATELELKALSSAADQFAVMRGPSNKNNTLDRLVAMVAETRDARHVGGDFDEAVLEVMSENPEGRRMLEGLKDRGGKVRLPAFFISQVGDHAAARYITPFNGIFISQSLIEGDGMTVDEFLKDPAKQREFMRKHDSLFFHELFHAKQFHKEFLTPGQLEKFPTQLHMLMTLQTEYEAHIHENFFVGEKLAKDPHGDVSWWQIYEYESFITDLDAFMEDIAHSPTYNEWFADIDSTYYNEAIAKARARWGEESVRGYLLLAKRADGMGANGAAKDYRAKAAQRAAELGIPIPNAG